MREKCLIPQKKKLHKGNVEEHGSHERWLVSYADFITLLFAFFVIMYATSNADVEKQKKLEDSIKVQFHLVGGAGSRDKAPNLEQEVMNLVIPSGSFPDKGGPREAQDYVERALQKDGKKQGVQDIYHDAVGVRIALAASTFFPEGSAKLKASALATLDKIAEILKSTNKRIIIEGHTDDTPIGGTLFPSNWELAAGRAGSVIRYFSKVHQMDPKRFVALSYGDQKPIVPNDTEEHKSQNRRIEIFIVTDPKNSEI